RGHNADRCRRGSGTPGRGSCSAASSRTAPPQEAQGRGRSRGAGGERCPATNRRRHRIRYLGPTIRGRPSGRTAANGSGYPARPPSTADATGGGQ
ncbi:unnamed protein product, partial [Symbiodinium sp. CCMP2456]